MLCYCFIMLFVTDTNCNINDFIRAWFYLLGEANVDLMRDREYLGTVHDIQLNADYCSVRLVFK